MTDYPNIKAAITAHDNGDREQAAALLQHAATNGTRTEQSLVAVARTAADAAIKATAGREN